MVTVSSVLYVGVDPDSGFPSAIKALDSGDTIAIERLPESVRSVTEYTTDNSGTFGAGSVDSDVSSNWQRTYEEVRDTSADLREASGTLNTASGDWQNTYNEVQDTSANLREASAVVSDNSSVWQVVRDTSTTWDAGGEAYLPDDVSGRWERTYEEVRDTSADLRQASSTLNDSSGNWQNTYEEVRDTSADLREASSVVSDNSGVWDVVRSTSSTWDLGGEAYLPDDVSGRWENTYEEVRDTSADLREASSVVSDNSGVWDVVRSTSSTWDAGGEAYLPDDVSGRWERTYEEVRDTSADLREASSTLYDSSGRWEGTYTNFNNTSSNLITASSRTDDLLTFSGNVETSTANLSSTLDTSVGNLRSSITANTGLIAINTSQLTVSGPYWNTTYEEVRDTSADLRQASSTLNDSSGNWQNTYDEVRDTSADLREASGTLNTASGNWQNTYDEVRDTSADLRDVSSSVRDNSGAWAVTSGIASGFGFIPNGPTKVLSSVEISGFGSGDSSGVSVFDGAIPVYSSALGRFNYLPDLAKPGGGYGVRWDPEVGAGGAIEISQDGTFIFTSPDGQNSVMIDTSGNYLSGTATFDMSGIRRLVAATIDSNTTSAVNLTVEDELDVQSDAAVFLPRGYRATSKDRFAVNGSGIGSDADNLYVTNGAGPFIFLQTSADGSIRTTSNELGLGAGTFNTIYSTPDAYLSGTIPSFYNQGTYGRITVSGTGVYEITSNLALATAGLTTLDCKIEVASVDVINVKQTFPSATYEVVQLQTVVFANAGDQIRVYMGGTGVQYQILTGSNLLIKRIG